MFKKLYSFETRHRVTLDALLLIYLSNLSEDTKREYAYLLNRLETIKPLAEINSDDALFFLIQESERIGETSQLNPAASNKVCYNTTAQKAHKLHKLYEFFRHRAIIEVNPFDAAYDLYPLGKKIEHKRKAKFFEVGEVRQIFDSINARTPDGMRDKAFLALLFGGGLRVSEALGIRIGQVEVTKAGEVVVYLASTKAGCDAHQEISPDLSKYITDFIAYRQQTGAKDVEPLIAVFIQGKAKWRYTPEKIPIPICRQTALLWFERLCRDAGLPRFTPHAARRTAIMMLLDANQSHRQVASFSRHSSVSMVEYYDQKKFSGPDSIAKKLKF
jgi:integrase